VQFPPLLGAHVDFACHCLTEPVQTARQSVPGPHAHSTAQFPPGGPRSSRQSTVDGIIVLSSGVWSGNGASVVPTSQMRAECCPVLLGLGGLLSLDSLLYDAKSRVFRRLDWLRNRERRFPCCGISSILDCWPSRFSSPCQRRGGERGATGRGAGRLKIIVAAGIADSAYSPEGKSRAVKCRLPRDLTDFQGCRAIWKKQLPACKYPPGTEMSHGNASTGAVTVCLLHLARTPGPQREGPFCAVGLDA
jgi:hypothetical protein